jgi:outer membrane protein TolC
MSQNHTSYRALAVFFSALVAAVVAVPELLAQGPIGYGGSAPGAAIGSLTGSEFQGSVTEARKPAGVLGLSLNRAVELGMENNLGLLLRREGVTAARGQRWLELSRLLPQLTTSAGMHHLKESLAITGISSPNIPPVVGPYNFYDGRVFLTQRIFDLEAMKRVQAAGHEVAAAELSERDARELVTVAVSAAYLQALAGYARVDTSAAQVATANTNLDRAVELHNAGLTPGIDELRARVEALTRTQQLIVAENELAKDKLGLLRLIGLPVGQDIVLTDQAPFEPQTAGAVDDLVAQGLRARDDYQAAQKLVKAAEAAREAALAERLPALVLDADYGYTGVTLSTLDETYHIVGSLRFPIFQGGRVHGDVLRAEALVAMRREELDDLRGKIEYEVRSALLDVNAAGREVEVTRKNVELAELALSQAQERFSAGIDDNLEVVQAQQSVAAAHEALVSSHYRHNLAKLLLARATGVAGAAGIGGR